MATAPSDTRPESEVDLFSPEVVADPFPVLAELRDLASAVYMSTHDYWLLARYDDVRAAAANWQSYTSAQGVALTPQFNENLAGSVLATDPPEHDQLRAVLSEKLAPRGLAQVRADIRSYADQLVDHVVARGRFDGILDVARVFPINVVADLVGLPEEGRDRLHPGADATFAGFGPFTPYLNERGAELESYYALMGAMTDRQQLRPGGWGEAVMDAIDDGRLSFVGGIKTISAYMTAGMDTTVNAIGALLLLFAENREIWSSLKQNPSLAGAVFEEILRLESPLTGFFRVTTQEVEVGGVHIPQGSRVLLHWQAANRDPRHYPDPDTFDIRRNPLDHMAFGYGVHSCAGQGLARMEAVTLLEALAARIDRIELTGEVVRGRNPIIRGLDSVPMAVVAAAALPTQ